MRVRLWVMAMAVLPAAAVVSVLLVSGGVSLAPALGALAAGLLVGLALALRLLNALSRPMARLRVAARRLRAAAGDVGEAPKRPGAEDLSQLASQLAGLGGDLRAALARARERQQQTEAIFAQMADGILVVDADLRIQRVNPAAADLLALAPDRAVGRTVIEATMHHALDGLFREAIAAGRTRSLRIETIRPRRRVLQALVTPLDDAGTGGAVAVFQDLTELDRLARVRRDFVTNMSHELRTPVTSIKVMVDSLQRGALREPALAEEFLQSMAEASDRLARLVDDVLALARVEAGPGRLEWTEFRLDRLVAEVVAAQRPLAQQHGVDLRVEGLDSMTIRGDVEGMRQAVANLVTNGIKYNTPVGSVSLRLRRADPGAVLSVADTGIGIAPEHLPRIFERFYRVDRGRSRELGGTGLGLAIVKRAIAAHGGRVTVESTPGQGSAFTVALPERLLVAPTELPRGGGGAAPASVEA